MNYIERKNEAASNETVLIALNVIICLLYEKI